MKIVRFLSGFAAVTALALLAGCGNSKKVIDVSVLQSSAPAQSTAAEGTAAADVLQQKADALCQPPVTARWLVQPHSTTAAVIRPEESVPTDLIYGAHVADLDGDGDPELLAVQWNGGDITLQVYECADGEARLAATADAAIPTDSIYGDGTFMPEEGAMDIFLQEDPSAGIFMQEYWKAWHFSDGLYWHALRWTYDGSALSVAGEYDVAGSVMPEAERQDQQRKADAQLGVSLGQAWSETMLTDQNAALCGVARVRAVWNTAEGDFDAWSAGDRAAAFPCGFVSFTQDFSTPAAAQIAPAESTATQSAAPADAGSLSSDSEYILPQSSTQALTMSDLQGLSAWEARVARNEILARHGRLFNDPQLQDYFNARSWYNGTIAPESFSTALVSQLEWDNMDLIKQYEATL